MKNKLLHCCSWQDNGCFWYSSCLLGGPLNLLINKNEVAIKDVALEIAKSFDYQHMMEFDTRYSDGQYKKTADNTKLMDLIGDFKFTPIDQGIQKNTEWFIKNFDNARK